MKLCPEGSLELIVASTRSGPNYDLAQALRAVASQNTTLQVNVRTLPGATQADAWEHLRGFPPDADVLAIASNMLITNHLTGRSRLRPFDLSPVALLLGEYMVFAVHSRLQQEKWESIFDGSASHSTAGDFSVGIKGRIGNARHLAVTHAFSGSGRAVCIKTRTFRRKDDAINALLSGEIDFYCDTAASISRVMQTAKVTPTAVSATHRLPAPFDDVPSLLELGIPEPYIAWRGIVGPPSMPKLKRAFWSDILRRLVNTPSWETVLRQHFWRAHFMEEAAFCSFLTTATATAKRAMAAV